MNSAEVFDISGRVFQPGGALSVWNPLEQGWLKQEAAKLADVFQRSSSNVEGRNGYLALRNQALLLSARWTAIAYALRG